MSAHDSGPMTANHIVPPEPRSVASRYGMAAVCVVGAIALRALFDPVLGPDLPLSTTFGFVAVAVWYGGWGPASLTAGLSYLAAKWLFIEPRFSFSFETQDVWGFAAYVSSIAVIIAIGEQMRRARLVDDVSETLEEQPLGGPSISAVSKRERLTILFSLALAIALLVSLGSLAVQAFLQQSVESDSVTHTHEVTAELEAMLSLLKDAETGQRGFLITKLRRYLEPYEHAIEVLPKQLRYLEALMADNPEQVRRLGELKPDIAKKLSILEEAIEAVRRDPMTAREIIQTDRGKAIMDRIRDRVGAMMEAERTLLVARTENKKAQMTKTLQWMVIFAGAAVLLTSIAGIVIFRDRRIVAQAMALRESEERLRLAQSSAKAGVFDWNVKTGKLTWTPELEAIYGLKPGTVQSYQDFSSRVHPDDLAALEREQDTALRDRKPFDLEFRIVHATGEVRWLSSKGREFYDKAGHLVRVLCNNMDITDRKRAEEAMAHLAAIVASSDDAIISMTLEGIIKSCNRAAERMYSYQADEIVGQPATLLIPADRSDEETEILKRIRRGERIENYETIRRRKDGTTLPVSLTVSPIADSEGKIIGASKIARDITEKKRAEEELRATNEALRKQTAALAEANKELESFSYSVSHDLRSPLRAIDAFSRIVAEEYGPRLEAEALRYLNIVRKAAGQAGELIDDLLEFSRLGRQAMHVRPTKMDVLVQEGVDDLRQMQEGRTIDLMIAPELPPCQGDRRLLKLVWTNLLANALKYTKYRDFPKIEVGWLPDDAGPDAVVYFVKDNGVGFDMKYVHKLFAVFQRLHKKEDFEGTGVGLAIVQRIVQRHGGRVWAEGKVDVGATFSFSLPKARR